MGADELGFAAAVRGFPALMVKAMPVANVAEIVDERGTRLWRVLDHYVSRAVEGLDLGEVEQIAADETSARAATTTSVCSGHGPSQGRLCRRRQGCSDGRRFRGVSGGARRQAGEHHLFFLSRS